MSRIPHDSRTASDAAESCAGLGLNFHPLNQTSLCSLEKKKHSRNEKKNERRKSEKSQKYKVRTFVFHPDGIYWKRKTRTCYDDLVPSSGSKRIVISDSSKNEQSSLVIGQFSAWRKI